MKEGAISTSVALLYIAGYSCIHLAAQFGHTAIVAYLIAKGQDVDLPDKTGMTALMWASYRVFGYAPSLMLVGSRVLSWLCLQGLWHLIRLSG